MSSEQRLYTFSQETKDKLRKFRLGTSRAKDPQAVICTNHWLLLIFNIPDVLAPTRSYLYTPGVSIFVNPRGYPIWGKGKRSGNVRARKPTRLRNANEFDIRDERSKSDLTRENIDIIDKKTLEVRQADSTVYTTLQDIADELPDNSPRFILLSYPLTLVRFPPSSSTSPRSEHEAAEDIANEGTLGQASGRLTVPYVLLSYMPTTCNAEQRMLYAGAKELMRRESETGKLIEVSEAEEVEGLEEQLKGEE